MIIFSEGRWLITQVLFVGLKCRITIIANTEPLLRVRRCSKRFACVTLRIPRRHTVLLSPPWDSPLGPQVLAATAGHRAVRGAAVT